MKYGIFRNILLFSFIIALPSCYQDLGNYEYKEINEIVITPGKYSFMPPAPGMTATVTIDPEVSQTMTEGTANLSYEWRRQVTAVSWETVCNDPVYNMEVTSADVSAINLIFAVTDTDLGITTYAEIPVIPEFAFSQTWFLLQNVNGQAVLGTVDGEGDTRGVNPDISTQISGLSLTGSPEGLGINPFRRSNSIFSGMASYEILLGVFTSEKPYILNGSTLAEHSLNYFRLLYGKTVSGDITSSPELMDGQRNGFAIIDDGRLWYAVPDEYSLMYAVNISDDLGGGDTYRAEDLCHYTRSQHLLLYDGLRNRFLRYSNANDLGMGYSDRQSIVEGGSAEYETYRTGTRRGQQAERLRPGKYSVRFRNRRHEPLYRRHDDKYCRYGPHRQYSPHIRVLHVCNGGSRRGLCHASLLQQFLDCFRGGRPVGLYWQGAGHHIVLFYKDHILCGWKQDLQGGPYQGVAFFGTRLDCRRS